MNHKIGTAIATLVGAFTVAVATAPVASAANDIRIGNRSQFVGSKVTSGTLRGPITGDERGPAKEPPWTKP